MQNPDTTPLSMDVLNVSQANFIIIKKQSLGLIFDCGSNIHSTDTNDNTELLPKIKDEITNKLNGLERVTIVISHDHQDHHNLLEPLSKLILNLNIQLTTIKAWEVLSEEIGNHLNDVLGAGVKVEPLIPSEDVGANLHDKCLVLKISYCNKNILLAADASRKLLLSLQNRIQDVDVVVFPHHGSNQDNVLELFKRMMVNRMTKRPLLGIISSNAMDTAKIQKFYALSNVLTRPFYDALETMRIPIALMGPSLFCDYHEVVFFDNRRHFPILTPSIYVHNQRPAIVPVFCTGDLGDYESYRITIDADGSITMCIQKAEKILYYYGAKRSDLPSAKDTWEKALLGVLKLTENAFIDRENARGCIKHQYIEMYSSPNYSYQDLQAEYEKFSEVEKNQLIPKDEKLTRLVGQLIILWRINSGKTILQNYFNTLQQYDERFWQFLTNSNFI